MTSVESLLPPLLFLFAALVDGEEPVLDGQGQDGHGGAVVDPGAGVVRRAAGPEPAGLWTIVVQEQEMKHLTVHLPVLTADLEHALRRVVDAVEEMRIILLQDL